MIIQGTVASTGRHVVLETGARLSFEPSDCASPLKPGDAITLDTERRPSLRSAKGTGAWNPVSERKISCVEETK